mmetsp:Transcript_57871/g.78887  ORF Transcript_57871/g.78887 Transcript_57871/m.78887 type:complete len:262 (-) Transcript_57871:335-1120(-)
MSTLGLKEMNIPGCNATTPAVRLLVGTATGMIHFLQAQLRLWARNLLRLLSLRGDAPEWSWKRSVLMGPFAAVALQEYEGRSGHDISIWPWAGDLNLISCIPRAMLNPRSTPEFLHIRRVSSVNTWPRLAQIRAHCDVEVTLERCVQRLRQRLANESAVRQRDLCSKQEGVLKHVVQVRSQSESKLLPPVESKGDLEPSAIKTIVKTTTMANFYYKKSRSVDNLVSIGRRNSENIFKNLDSPRIRAGSAADNDATSALLSF